jgi:hypothetical protein
MRWRPSNISRGRARPLHRTRLQEERGDAGRSAEEGRAEIDDPRAAALRDEPPCDERPGHRRELEEPRLPRHRVLETRDRKQRWQERAARGRVEAPHASGREQQDEEHQTGAVAALVAANASATSPNPICVAARIFFRSPPSTMVPAGSVSAMTESARASPVAPRMRAFSVRSQVSQPIAVDSIWRPMLDAKNATAKNR